MSEDLDRLKEWTGKKEVHHDVVSAWPVQAMTATLDRTDALPDKGADIPLGWHWFYFLDAKPASELGSDGHPKRGGFLPPVPLPRRMWAGGRIEFRRPLRMGEALRKDSEILSVQPKTGRTGSMVFVTVRHSIYGSDEITTIEEQDIVYRDAAKAGDVAPPGKAAPTSPKWHRPLTADPVLLFRFSALTFNGHRIHYDLPYATQEEHYQALVVHGPLQAILMLDLCRRESARSVAHLDYRGMGALFHAQQFSVNGIPSTDGSSAEVWTANAHGTYCMSGKVKFA